MRIFPRLFAIVLAALFWPITAAISAVERHAWPKLEAHDILDLTHAVHATGAAQESARSRFSAFVMRLLDHDLYVAGHFDPGRTPA